MRELYSLQEHQAKKLVPKEFNEMVGQVQKVSEESLKTLNESAKGKKGRKLVVTIEAIHVGRTKNFTYYTAEGLQGGLSSWTQPYNKPVITHHNEHSGEPIGRILDAKYEEATMSGKAGLVFTVEITDPVAQEKVLDGRYQTVSIGASTNKVTCNICGTDRTESWCDHYPGESYGSEDDKQVAHLIIGETYGREVSYVNTPADENAGNRSVQVVEESEGQEGGVKENSRMTVFQVAEGLMQSIANPDVNLYSGLEENAKKTLDSLVHLKTNESGEPEVTNTTETTPVGTDVSLAESVEVLTKENQTLLAEKQMIQESLTKAIIEKDKLSTQVEEMTSEKETLLAENAQLVEDAHKATATRVVELKQRLCKADVVGKETDECVTEHVARTKESLQDSLKELLAEMAVAKPVQGSVTNPGVAPTDDLEEGAAKDKTYTLQEAENIFKGMFSRGRK